MKENKKFPTFTIERGGGRNNITGKYVSTANLHLCGPFAACLHERLSAPFFILYAKAKCAVI